ncbi:MAG: hypothetical protein ACLGIG_00935 [Actinomycetes bacterium]
MTTTRPRPPAISETRSRGPAALAVAAVVLVAALVGVVLLADRAGDDDTPPVTDVQEADASDETYAAVETDMAKDEVEELLRPALPVDTRVLERYEDLEPQTPAAECVYYERGGGVAGELYRFCFDEDELVDKTVILPDEPGITEP